MILYISILLHCIVQWVLEVMSPSACSFIIYWFPLFFTIYFGLHGHFHIFKDSASLLFWFATFLRGHILHVFHLCFVPVLFSTVFFWHFLAYAFVWLLFIVQICEVVVKLMSCAVGILYRRSTESDCVVTYPSFNLAPCCLTCCPIHVFSYFVCL
jgi:hypothetical protein